MSALPDDNPKTAQGAFKPAFHFIPPVAEMVLGQAMANGGMKYGQMNWRNHAVSSSVYYNAMRRHMSAWLDGEDVAPDSGVHHLGHVMASCAILLDAAAQGRLNDDRPIKGTFAKECERLTADADEAAQKAVEGERREPPIDTAPPPYWRDRSPAAPEPPIAVGDEIVCTCQYCRSVLSYPKHGRVARVAMTGYWLESNVFVETEDARRVQ